MRWVGWDDTNAAALLRLIGEGFTSSEAAARLGCTRNAAIGKAGRLGVGFGGNDLATPEAIAARIEANRRKGKPTAPAEPISARDTSCPRFALNDEHVAACTAIGGFHTIAEMLAMRGLA